MYNHNVYTPNAELLVLQAPNLAFFVIKVNHVTWASVQLILLVHHVFLNVKLSHWREGIHEQKYVCITFHPQVVLEVSQW